MGRFILAFLTLSFVAGNLLAQEKGLLVPDLGQFPYKVYTAEDFDGHFQILGLSVSEKNLLYTASNTHLLEYDGVSWRDYGYQIDDIITNVKAGPNGRLYWAGPSEIGYIEPGDDGKPVYYELIVSAGDTILSNLNTRSIEMVEDDVFFITNEGVIQFDPNTGEQHWFSLPEDSLHSFTYNGKLFLSFDLGVFWEWEGGRFVSTDLFERINDTPLLDVFKWEDQMIAVAEHQVLFCGVEQDSLCEEKLMMEEYISGFNDESGKIIDALLTKKGLLVLATQGQGVLLYDMALGNYRILDQNNGLAGSITNKIALDQEEGLWVAATGGISRIDLTGNLTVFPEDYYLDGFTTAQMANVGPYHYISTTGGIYGFNKQSGEWRNIYPKTELCRSFASSPLGILTVCGNEVVALNEFEAEAVFTVTANLISLKKSRTNPNLFYAGSHTDLVILEVSDRLQLQARYYPGAPYFARGFYDQGPDTLWMGSLSDGIYRFVFEDETLKEVDSFDEEDGISGQYPRPIEIDGKLKFVSTKGLFSNKASGERPIFVQDSTFTAAYNASGQGAIWSAELGQDEGYWLAGDARLSLAIKQADGMYRWEEFPLLQRMQGKTNLVYVDQESRGILWSAWVKKIVRFRIDARPPTNDYQTIIRSIAFGDSVLYDGHGPLPLSVDVQEKNNAIRIDYAAPRYSSLDKMTYAIKLEGFDDAWSSWSEDTHKDYTGLREGTYRFLVKARDVYGVESRPAELSFNILAPWYQSRLFLGNTLMLLLLGILLGARKYSLYRTRLLEEKNVELEETIQKRTKEISNKNEELIESNRLLEVVNTELSVINDQLTVTNEELQVKTLELRNALEANKDILGITAHDLKNPISGMLSMAELLMMELNEDEREALLSAHEYAPLIKQESTRMLTIIENLLDKYREGYEEKLNTKLTNVPSLVSGVIKMNHALAKDKEQSIQFISQFEDDVPLDTSKMERVLDNLISNAIKYSEPGSEIKIFTAKVENNLRIAVADSGPGLSEEDKKRVFGKLQRLSARPTAGERSTGLGLYIVKQLVEFHGGKVGVDSHKGEGATFWVLLPIMNNALSKEHDILSAN